MKKILLCLLIISFLLPASTGICGCDFDGVDDYIECGTKNFGSNVDITLSMWFKTTSTAEMYLFGEYFSGNPGVQFTANIGTVNKINMYTNAGVTRISSTTSVTDGNWYHIIFEYNKTTEIMQIFINGISEVSGNAGNVVWDDWEWEIGASGGDGTVPTNGLITEVAVWTAILTAGEKNNLVFSRIKGIPLQIQPANLKGYWPMDSGTHGVSADLDTAWDMSGNGNHGNPDNGANNTGMAWSAETILSYAQKIMNWQ